MYKLFKPATIIIAIALFFFSLPNYPHQLRSLDEFKIFDLENECRNCALDGKVFSNGTLRSVRHVNAHLAFSNLNNTLWQNINLEGAAMHDLSGSRMHFEHCEMRHTNLSYSDLPYLQVDPSNHLEVVNFDGSGLEYSNFSGVILDRPYFTNTVLEEVNFSYAKIYEGNFTGARLTDADFTDAKARDCDFTNAKLHGVDFTRADLRGSKITPEQLATVKSICASFLPDGTRGGC